MRRLIAGGAAVAALTLGLSGCGLSSAVYDAPLPGGADVGAHPVTLSADFDDVLDLVPQSSVKVNDVAVGRVSKITLNPDGRTAHVALVVNRSVHLPMGTTARLDQTSLLGEKYVALQPPAKASTTRLLADGDRLGLADTSESAQVEDVLGSLSLVLNGGDIGQFQEISRELSAVSTGRSGEIRDFLTQLDRLVSTLSARKESITSALDGLNRLGERLSAGDAKISNALDHLSPGMKVLAEQRPQLVKMLQALDRLSGITLKTLDESQRDIVDDLKKLDPILDQLADAGKALPDSLQILLTYPFPDEVLKAIKGDYFNAFVTTNFRTPGNCASEGCDWPQPDNGSGTEGGTGTGGASGSPSPSGSASPKLRKEEQSPPTLLPPTDSALPGLPSETVPAPGSSSPSEPGSSGGGSPSGLTSPESSSTPQSTQSPQTESTPEGD